MRSYRRGIMLIVLLLLTGSHSVVASEPQEYVTTTPVLADGVLYVASWPAPRQRGHLRAIDLAGPFQIRLWDAADKVPLAGVGANPGELADSDPPAAIGVDNLYRTIFTNLDGSQLPLTAARADDLHAALGVATTTDAQILIHAMRGRLGGTPGLVAGSMEDPQRLWSISRSSPILVGASPVDTGAAHRDRVLYAGGSDGMLHAFFVSRWQEVIDGYPVDDPSGGTELWAYLPGSFLASLAMQPLDDYFGEPVVHLDGSPVATELFLDLDGDGRRHWHTLLVGTGTRIPDRRSCLFVMEVTDPYRPQLLWEKQLPGTGVGRTRGAVVGACGTGSEPASCIYFTADVTAENGAAGIHALAVETVSGQLRWQFNAPYGFSGPVAEATPALPSLMDLDGNGKDDTLAFGDLAGRLWALALADGRAYGDAPVFLVPGGPAEPIGAGVAAHGRVAVFGTGGVEGADPSRTYALYAVEIFPDGGRLRWTYPLSPGERVWQTPRLDASGNLLLGTAIGTLVLDRPHLQPGSGRLVELDDTGAEQASRGTAAANIGRTVTAPGVALSVSLTGETVQYGTAARLTGPTAGPVSVRILSWRPL